MSGKNFAAFLVRHGVYRGITDVKIVRILATKTFRTDFGRFLRASTTREDDYHSAVTFILTHKELDDEVKPGLNYGELFAVIERTRKFTKPTESEDNEGSTHGEGQPDRTPSPSQQKQTTGDQPEQGGTAGADSNDSGKKDKSPDVDANEDANVQTDDEAGSGKPDDPTQEVPTGTPATGDQVPTDDDEGKDGTTQDDGEGRTSTPTPTPDDAAYQATEARLKEAHYQAFLDRGGAQGFIHRTKADGTRQTDDEYFLEAAEFRDRFDNDTSSIDPNKWLYTEDQLKAFRALIKSAFPAMETGTVRSNILKAEEELHALLEGHNIPRGMGRFMRVNLARKYDTYARIGKEYLRTQGIQPYPVDYNKRIYPYPVWYGPDWGVYVDI